MNKNYYTESQIKELLNNKYVKNCTKNQIIYTSECKIEAIWLRESTQLSANAIFHKLWFPDYIYKSRVPNTSLNTRKNIKKEKWIIW